ncbi:hypothetical protein PS6_010843, partial [Mucor atramentarius]
QQIAALQEQLHNTTTTPIQSADNTANPLPLHPMGTRPHHYWSPWECLTELMSIDTLLHTTPFLSDPERKTIIESYPPIAHLGYKAPATILSAETMMNRGHCMEYSSLKQLQ